MGCSFQLADYSCYFSHLWMFQSSRVLSVCAEIQEVCVEDRKFEVLHLLFVRTPQCSQGVVVVLGTE